MIANLMEIATIVIATGAILGGIIGATATVVNQWDQPVLVGAWTGAVIGASLGYGLVLASSKNKRTTY